jgi:hypothetical protein
MWIDNKLQIFVRCGQFCGLLLISGWVILKTLVIQEAEHA